VGKCMAKHIGCKTYWLQHVSATELLKSGPSCNNLYDFLNWWQFFMSKCFAIYHMIYVVFKRVF
jgi:hypothetical protein